MAERVGQLEGFESGRVDDATLVRRARRSDGRFELIGLAVLVISMIVLLSLIADFMGDAGR
mgnify:CR=1 FL=1